MVHRFQWICWLLLGTLVCSACRDLDQRSSSAQLRESAKTYAALKLTNETRHQGLRDELARVKAENGFPDAIASQRAAPSEQPPGWRKPDGPVIADSENAALAMLEAIPPEKRRRVRRQIEKAYPQSVRRCTALELERIRDVLTNWDDQREAFRRAVKLKACDFAFPYAEGLSADLEIVDVALMGHRLMALHAIDRVYHNELETAMPVLVDLFRLSALAADEANLTMRTAAAQMRIEALQIVELIVHDADVTQENVEQMRLLIEEHLNDWRDDGHAWRGERAIGLHAFEMIRDGQILSLLSAEEAKRVMDEGPQRFGRAVQKNIDEDELFYLRTMREVIELCHLPYYQRADRIHELAHKLDALRGGPNESIVSQMLLDQDLLWGQRLQATDRTAMEAWLVALSKSTNSVFAKNPVNWFTGQPYTVVDTGSRFEISGINPAGHEGAIWPEPIIVPRFDGAPEATAQR